MTQTFAFHLAEKSDFVCTAFDKLSVPGQTDWVIFARGNVMCGVTGTATSFTAIPERCFYSPIPPADCYWAPADSSAITGDASAGVAPRTYLESGQGWWRIRVTDVVGGYVIPFLSGTMP